MSLARIWDRRVVGWHTHVTSTHGFEKVRDRLLAISGPRPTDACVDLGAGTGFVAIALAPLVDSVLAVDISPAWMNPWPSGPRKDGLQNVRTRWQTCGPSSCPRPASISSCPATRCTTSATGQAGACRRAARWLRPGAARGRRHDVRPRRKPARPGDLVAKKRQRSPSRDLPGGGGSPRTLPGTDWASATSTRPHRILATGAVRCRLDRCALRTGRRRSRHCPRRPAGHLTGP